MLPTPIYTVLSDSTIYTARVSLSVQTTWIWHDSQDIKLENVMVASVTPFVIKLIDFGQAGLLCQHDRFWWDWEESVSWRVVTPSTGLGTMVDSNLASPCTTYSLVVPTGDHARSASGANDQYGPKLSEGWREEQGWSRQCHVHQKVPLVGTSLVCLHTALVVEHHLNACRTLAKLLDLYTLLRGFIDSLFRLSLRQVSTICKSTDVFELHNCFYEILLNSSRIQPPKPM